MSPKPVVVYVDDEANNLELFAEIYNDQPWEIRTFLSPIEAMKVIKELDPAVIVSDQRMPQMQGYQFLEICRALVPMAARIIMTGFSDEENSINSIRYGHITDFLKKPFDPAEVSHRLELAIQHNASLRKTMNYETEASELKGDMKFLEEKLNAITREKSILAEQYSRLRDEFASWVPQFIVDSTENQSPPENHRANVASITFDIKGSARFLEVIYDGMPLRNRVIQLFTEAVHRNRGYRESVSGDSSYGHFGLIAAHCSPNDSALAAALDFKTALNNLSKLLQLDGEELHVGIALHSTKELPIHIHTTHYQGSNNEILVQKSFDTSSYSADLLHRIEKLTHSLPGSNIIMTSDFCDGLIAFPHSRVSVGHRHFKGHKQSVQLFLIPDNSVLREDLEEFGITAMYAAA